MSSGQDLTENSTSTTALTVYEPYGEWPKLSPICGLDDLNDFRYDNLWEEVRCMGDNNFLTKGGSSEGVSDDKGKQITAKKEVFFAICSKCGLLCNTDRELPNKYICIECIKVLWEKEPLRLITDGNNVIPKEHAVPQNPEVLEEKEPLRLITDGNTAIPQNPEVIVISSDEEDGDDNNNQMAISIAITARLVTIDGKRLKIFPAKKK